MIRNYSTAAFVLAILAFSICLPSKAAELPPGTYMQTCTQPAMQGNTLTAVCPDVILGNQRSTSLRDADDCNSTGHDIANVNGSLRCIYAWDPNGFGIISRPKDEQKDGNVIKVWRIDQPGVTSPTTYYGTIGFKAGDTITVNAGGCVQTGGSGSTWKSYTYPTGDEAEILYSGMIWIPGVINSPVRIAGTMGREWHVRTDLQPPVLKQLFLRLGYQDDAYGDNGYYAHDNGNNNQCLNVSGAWVEIKIVRSLKTPDDDKHVWSPAKKPFDMVWDKEDTQGLPLNPRWFIQGEKEPHPQSMPDFADHCGAAFSGGNTVNYAVLAEKCSSQMPYIDLDTSPFVGWSKPFSGGPGYCTDDGFLHGHLDWGIATFTGTAFFESWTTGTGEDDDYNMTLPRDDKSIVTVGDDEASLNLEFNSDESVDQFQDPWWTNLDSTIHGLAGQNGKATVPANTPLGELLVGKPAVTIGLIGIDGVHGHGHAESHPVFALAIQSASREGTDSRDETWDFFVRNFGNEGNCSELIHYWEGLGGKYYVQLPTPPEWSDVTGVTVPASEAWLWNGSSEQGSPHGEASVVVAKDSQATYLEVALPAAVESGSNQGGWGINGKVTIHYALKPDRVRKKEAKQEDHPAQVTWQRKPPADKEVDWEALQNKISDGAVKQRIQQALLTAFPHGKGPKYPNKRIDIDSKVHEHKPLVVHHGELTRPHRARDPRMERLNTQLRQAVAGIAPPPKKSAAPKATPPAQ